MNKKDLITRMENALGTIYDEAWHALETEADKPLEVLRKNMAAIKKVARIALKELRAEPRSGGL